MDATFIALGAAYLRPPFYRTGVFDLRCGITDKRSSGTAFQVTS